MATPFTQAQYDALIAAIAEGVTRVKYETKEVEYRSLDEMLKLKDLMESELGLKMRGERRLASTSKGLNGC